MKKKEDTYNLKTQEQDNLDVLGKLFQGMPQTMENIDFSLGNLIEKEKKKHSNLKASANRKIVSFQLQFPSNGTNNSQNTSKPQSCGETLKRLKEHGGILNTRKLRKFEANRKRYCTTDLKSSLGSQRVSGICKNVITKLRRNNIYEPALNQQQFSKFNFSFKHNGFVLQECIINILDIYGCIITLFLLFSQTLSIAFSEFQDSRIVQVISALGLLFYCLQIFLNFFLVKKINGVSITKIEDIAHQYLHSYFVIDISIVIFTAITFLTTDLFFRGVLLFLTFLKLPYMMDKFSKFERGIVSSLYYQRYWSLLKIILFNFVFAHFIAIILNLMTKNQSYNWQVVKGISNSPIIQKYIWSYYWATNIMLTVGFGDIVAVTCQEAVWMIFVEIISCIAFSYNISCLGGLISNIRAQKEEIQKNRSIFQNMCKNSGFQKNLIEKIESYIDQSVIIKNKFNIQEEKQFIQNLPSGFKQQVMYQSNKNMLARLHFFGSLLDKSIYKLSEKIQRQMYHPDQILRPFNSPIKVRIFKEGKIGYVCRNKPNWQPVNKISKSKIDDPFLMTIEFLTRKHPNFQIKSLDYSIVYELSEQDLIEALRTVSKDFQYYSFLKDKSKHIVDEFETVTCDLCTTKHTHCDCPKLHYIPLHEHIVHKHLHSLKVSKNQNTNLFERKKVFQNSLKMIDKCKKGIYMRKETQQPISKSNYKNQIIFMDLMSKKPFNDQKVLKEKENESQFMDNVESFKMTTSRMMNSTKRQSLQECEDPVWKLDIDVCWNYEIYYPLQNSLNLQQNFSLQKRSSNWMQHLYFDNMSEVSK